LKARNEILFFLREYKALRTIVKTNEAGTFERLAFFHTLR